ncbi:MAG: hypothetical protein HC897_15190 [Thermoanaerobaculia bacterium]|nr:hypothetical protein [Thermoanaerobaculia bacterium]
MAGFRSLDDVVHCAFLSIDLAELSLRFNRPDEAVAILTDALPLIEALRFEGEALGALKLLQRAVAERELSLDLVEQIQTHARRLPGP